MQLLTPDWIIIILYCALISIIGLLYSRRSSQNKETFFVAGRKLNWFVAGTSMAAVSFASDTPLVVSGLVRKGGIYENWIWWTLIISGMFTFFFFSRLWRRSGMLTDIQFVSFRYSGRAVTYLRIFKVFFYLFGRCITIAWVMVAMYKIFYILFDLPETISISYAQQNFSLSSKILLLVVLAFLSLFYTVIAGFWGVAVTDVLHFAVAMIGSFLLASIVLIDLGGPTRMVSKLLELPGITQSHLTFIPTFSNRSYLENSTFLILTFAYWLPRAAGSSSVVQRLLACKDEKHASLSMFWGFFAIVVLRSWPWIVIGLASLIYFPLQAGEDPESVYPQMIAMFLPVGLRGLMIASFLAAFLSTVNSLLTLSASYLVNDLYIPYLCKKEKSEHHFVSVSRIAILLVLMVSVLFALQMGSILSAWKYFAEIIAGTSFVLMARWYWWRVNAWSEISAILTSFTIANVLGFIPVINSQDYFAVRFLINLILSTLIWVSVTLLTRPTSREKLNTFYNIIQPRGCWKPFRHLQTDKAPVSFRLYWAGWLLSVVSLFSSLFGIGFMCLGEYVKGGVLLAASLLTGRSALKKMYAILK